MRLHVVVTLVIAFLLASCGGSENTRVSAVSAQDARAAINRALPRVLSDAQGWTNDLYAAFSTLTVTPSNANICAVVAVIAQESSFRVDPSVPGLGAIAFKEIDARAARAHVPQLIVRGVLNLKSPNGHTYTQRIEAARTERELSDVYEDLISELPLGRTLFEVRNPIRTRGPMQVSVLFAERFSQAAPYPYPIKRSIADELFTRRGGLYFGVAHLLDYPAPYDDYLYRFADFNAGQYASRNAAFQSALSVVSGVALTHDGALLPHEANEAAIGNTESVARSIALRLKLNPGEIHSALAEGKGAQFERSALYERTFALAEAARQSPLPRALVPQIRLEGPKLKHALSTDWYAHRVNERFTSCLSRSNKG